MKKLLLLLPVLCLSGQVLAKVSYEDAIESIVLITMPTAPCIFTRHQRTRPDELPDSSQNGDLGHWVKVSSTTTDVVNAGAYSALLSLILRVKRVTKAPKG
ncbi:hypothetical protein JHT19_25110 (plasmid) [Vibrio parahaemolyticus]|nr:hypothetical protein JHT19_25110 [Vibrio parahaemolyticus]